MNKLEFLKKIEDNVSDEVKNYLKENKVSIDCVKMSDNCTALIFERSEKIPENSKFLDATIVGTSLGNFMVGIDGINYDCPEYYETFFKYLEKLSLEKLGLGKESYYKPYHNNFMHISHGNCYFYSRKCYYFTHSKICESYADFIIEKLYIKKDRY